VIGVLATKQPGGGTIELRWNGSLKASVSLNATSVLKTQLITVAFPSVQTGTLAQNAPDPSPRPDACREP
jgi:hypothetical protein